MGLDMLEVAPLEEFIVAAAPLEGFIFAANEKLDTEASPTARHTLLRTLLNLPTRPMLNLPTLLTRPTLLKLPTLPNLPTNRPTPTTPLHPSVVVNTKLMLEATESLPDLFESLPTRRPRLPTHRPPCRPLLLWKRDMVSLGLLDRIVAS